MTARPTATTPPISEDAVSVIPALHLLTRLGWSHLTPAEATALRHGRTAEVVLTDVLRERLVELNRVETQAGSRDLTDDEVGALLYKLTHLADDGLVTTNETIWTLLRHGADVSIEVDGRRGNHTLRLVDWDRPERNTWHVTEEFVVDRAGAGRGAKDRRPDLVCFVNGLPFAVLECKRHVLPGQGRAVDQAVSQHLRNQRTSEIPRLYHFAQVLLALSGSDARYGVTGTPETHWGRWREQEFDAPDARGLLAPVGGVEATELRARLSANPFRKGSVDIDSALEALAAPDRVASEQDRLIQALLRPERLLELVRRATIFEKGEKNERKMARYQQFFCMRKCLRTVEQRLPDGRRAGGIVWHTQGSGKSLTMFLVAQRLLEVYGGEDARVVVVTDRNDLDEQILGTFQRAGAEVVQASSGRHLGELLHSTRSGVITTTVHKFEKFLGEELTPLDDPNVFVLADEGHRTQTGTLHAAMRKALPRAALIGFTGTPILRGDKQTVQSFGKIIDTYTIKQAVEDGAVVNLVYEGRHVDLQVNSDRIDAWIDHHLHQLDEDKRNELKRRYSRLDVLNETQDKINRTAFDVSRHFQMVFQTGGTGLKAQLVAPSKITALRYKEALDELGVVTSEVVISPPDTREGNTDVDEESRSELQAHWGEMMATYGSAEGYRREVVRRFKQEPDPEILIVVDMLLTGFDAPRNACLYLTRSLREHTLLQAIARVNRICTGKEYGLIVDYYGVVQELDDAVEMYSAFDGEYDPDDLDGLLTDIRERVKSLPDSHRAVLSSLDDAAVKTLEGHVAHLEDEEARGLYYARVAVFARDLKAALGSDAFWASTAADTIARYKNDLKYFVELRRALALQYAEHVDFGQYDAAIRKLLDEQVEAEGAQTVVRPTTVFDEEAFTAEIDSLGGAKSKAKAIRNRLNRTITQNLDQDPAFFESLGRMLEETWEKYREGRMSDAEVFAEMQKMAKDVRDRANVDDRTVYHGVVAEAAGEALADISEAEVAGLAAEIEAVIEAHSIVDWQENVDAQNRMKTGIENALFAWKDARGLDLDFDVIDRILDRCVDTARARSRR